MHIPLNIQGLKMESKMLHLEGAVDFNANVLDINGKIVYNQEFDPETKKVLIGEPLTLGDVCASGLIASPKDGVERTQDEARLLWKLAQKIHGDPSDDTWGVVKLSSKQKTLILQKVFEAYNTTVYNRVWEAIEGNSEDDE
jgi:hypothetical protein